jgi:hypothetical protein
MFLVPRFSERCVRRPSRTALRSFCLVAAVCAWALPVFAQRDATAAETSALRDAIAMYRAAMTGIAGTLPGLLNPPGQNGQATQSGYEPVDGRPATWSDAFDTLERMLAGEPPRVRVLTAGTANGRTIPRAGLDADEIQIAERLLTDLTTGTPAARATAKVLMGATMVNELAHVFQTIAAVDAVDCDQERDSDCASILYLDRILAALTDAAGNAHTSLAAMAADAGAVAGLTACLAGMGLHGGRAFRPRGRGAPAPRRLCRPQGQRL